jgi:hypothetical protein
MKYVNEGRRKKARVAREADEALFIRESDVLLNQAFPRRTEEQTMLLRRIIRQFRTDFNRLPRPEELVNLLKGILEHWRDGDSA